MPTLMHSSFKALHEAVECRLADSVELCVLLHSRRQRARRATQRFARERAEGQLKRELAHAGLIPRPGCRAVLFIGTGYGKIGTSSGRASSVSKILPPTRLVARIASKHCAVVYVTEHRYATAMHALPVVSHR